MNKLNEITHLDKIDIFKKVKEIELDEDFVTAEELISMS